MDPMGQPICKYERTSITFDQYEICLHPKKIATPPLGMTT